MELKEAKVRLRRLRKHMLGKEEPVEGRDTAPEAAEAIRLVLLALSRAESIPEKP